MKCKEIQKLLSGYIDNNLGPSQALLVEQHMNECKGCEEEHAVLRMLVKELGSLETIAPANGFVDRVNCRIEGHTLKKRISSIIPSAFRSSLPIETAGVAATALLAVLVFNNIQGSINPAPTDTKTVQETQAEQGIFPAGQTAYEQYASGAMSQELPSKKGADIKSNNKPIQVALIVDSFQETDNGQETVTAMTASSGTRSGYKKRSEPMTVISNHKNSSSSVTAEQGASAALTPSELALIRLNEILAMLDGRIATPDTDTQTSDADHLFIEIPPYNYREFLERMDYIGVREPHFPEQPSDELDMVRIQISVEER